MQNTVNEAAQPQSSQTSSALGHYKAIYRVHIFVKADTRQYTPSLPVFRGDYDSEEEAHRKGQLFVKEMLPRANSYEVTEIIKKPYRLRVEGYDNQGWYNGFVVGYFDNEQEAIEKVLKLYDTGYEGLTIYQHLIQCKGDSIKDWCGKNLKPRYLERDYVDPILSGQRIIKMTT